jgi:hypothetical protein
MNIRIEHPSTHETYIPRTSPMFSSQRDLPWRALEEGLVEMVGPCTLLPYRQKCGVQFGTDSTVARNAGFRLGRRLHLFREPIGR